MTFGERIKKLRKENYMTQDKLAESVGVTKSAVSAWENDMRRPSFDILNEMCDLFKVDLSFLLGQTDTNTYNKEQMSQEEMDDLGLSEVCDDYYDLFNMILSLDEFGLAAMRAIAKTELNRCREENTVIVEKEIKVQVLPVAKIK